MAPLTPMVTQNKMIAQGTTELHTLHSPQPSLPDAFPAGTWLPTPDPQTRPARNPFAFSASCPPSFRSLSYASFLLGSFPLMTARLSMTNENVDLNEASLSPAAPRTPDACHRPS